MRIWALTGMAVFCWTVSPLSAQTVRIRVEEADNGKPLSGVIIRAVKADGQTLRYGLTDQDGCVEMAMPESADTLKVSLLGFRERTFVRPFQNQYLILLETAPLSIRAAGVTAHKVEEVGDTIRYLVPALKNKEDRVLSDVLERLPGVEVSKAGISESRICRSPKQPRNPEG